MHDVEFSDVQVKDDTANIIAKNMLTRVDSEGVSLTLIDSILDLNKDGITINTLEKYFVTSNGQSTLRKNALGWKL